MCGFVGEFLTCPDAPAPDGELLRRMGETLRHRGPDGTGLDVTGWYGLHHSRLAIIDLEGGAQPLASPSGDTVVAFNGEIYNHLELRARLEERGHRFRTRADTEVLLHGWQEWGVDLVGRLRGMFAFALVDVKRRRLLLAQNLFHFADGRVGHTKHKVSPPYLSAFYFNCTNR